MKTYQNGLQRFDYQSTHTYSRPEFKPRVPWEVFGFTQSLLANMEPEDDISQEIVNVTRTVFRDVWDNFYDWENAYCQAAINSLSQQPNAICRASRSIIPNTKELTTQSIHTLHASPKPSEEGQVTELTCRDYRGESFIVSPTMITADVVSVLEFFPYPEYESVTPASRSIFHGDDAEAMPFIPYPEDPTFDFFDHTFEYKTFAWQEGFQDPDSKLIYQDLYFYLDWS